jgi:hypothetical protein
MNNYFIGFLFRRQNDYGELHSHHELSSALSSSDESSPAIGRGTCHVVIVTIMLLDLLSGLSVGLFCFIAWHQQTC